ncbi:SDR family NAD(P)-dependent oxidoreductase [Bacteroidales bacterium OttesenSCG-928-J16]|nr:SDR family NAD(P)-dependent oxidoreductase [Bacteroidales bacterium OttesenSCG-928-J16]
MYTTRDRKNQTALVTGAASGIGLCIARELAGRGCDVVMVDIQEEKISEAARVVAETFQVAAHPIYMDLSLPDAAKGLFDYCRQKKWDIDVLVNNAGIFFFDETVRVAEEKVLACIRLHIETPTMLCKLFGAEMKNRNSGYILIISSLAAWMPYPGLTLYAATKRYLKTFAKAFHHEMSGYNVGVTAICPGAVNTSLYGLNERLTKIALNAGIMMKPEKLAKKAVNAMFRKRVLLIPGFINRFFLPLIAMLPVRWARAILKRSSLMERYNGRGG